jgi:hypothetical protein
VKFNIVMQVDTACHRLSGFIEKSARAGCKRVFIGLENINPESLKGAQKGQNLIVEYRQMLQAWRAQKVITTAGYILGFPGDTPETIVRDIEIIKRELPIDILEFFYLTPLPGSADHKALFEKGVEMDPDLNKYDLNNICTAHDTMSREDWQRAYRMAWDTYFSPEHCETLLKRARADGLPLGKIVGTMSWFYGSVLFEGVHPLESGFFRMKFRRDRRPGFPVEPMLTFYPKYAWELAWKTWSLVRLFKGYRKIRRRLEADPETLNYTDTALTPVTESDLGTLEMFSASDAARDAAARAQRRKKDTARRLEEATDVSKYIA